MAIYYRVSRWLIRIQGFHRRYILFMIAQYSILENAPPAVIQIYIFSGAGRDERKQVKWNRIMLCWQLRAELLLCGWSDCLAVAGWALVDQRIIILSCLGCVCLPASSGRLLNVTTTGWPTGKLSWMYNNYQTMNRGRIPIDMLSHPPSSNSGGCGVGVIVIQYRGRHLGHQERLITENN